MSKRKTGERYKDAHGIARAIKVLERHQDEIKHKYGITQMAVGFKTEKGKITDKVALLFYVNKKLNEPELTSRGIEIVPKEIECIPTDIVEVPGGFTQRLEKKADSSH